MINKLIVFDLKGKFACWKKFYTNSSSFTYFIPTRTNLIGLIASILELPRDSYYEELNTSNCKISLEIKSDLKKQFHCLNYFKKPNQRDYTQVRLEILSSLNIKQDEIIYRIYIWFKDNKKFTFEEFENKLKNKNFGFGVYLGQRQFRGYIEYISTITKLEFKSNIKEINTITNINNLKSKEDIIYDNSEIDIERMPLDFKFVGKDEEINTNILNRELENIDEIVFNKLPNSLIRSSSYFNNAVQIKIDDEVKNLGFYEQI